MHAITSIIIVPYQFFFLTLIVIIFVAFVKTTFAIRVPEQP
jgi:hypothetical protein